VGWRPQLQRIMKLSIIIPTWNEAGRIRLAIQRAWQAGADEVIVADGNSPDGTAEIAGREECTVCQGPAGRGGQQHLGACQASGEVLLFLHADSWFPQSVRHQLAHSMQDKSVVYGVFRQRIEADDLAFRWLERGNAWRASWLRLPYGDQGIFVRRSTYDAVGGFDEVPLMEDVMLARKLRRFGAPALLPGPIVTSARRWKQHGICRQTIRNWCLLAAFQLGVPPARLARYYDRRNRLRPENVGPPR